MSDLTDRPREEMTDDALALCEAECLSMGGARGGRLRAALFELRRLRSALAADGERVRSVVERIAAHELGPNGPLGSRSWDVLAHAIATRAAEQLATAAVGLSEIDREAIDDLRRYLVRQESKAVEHGRRGDGAALHGWQRALSRLLGGSE